MLSVMNDYVSKIRLTTNEITKGILNSSLAEHPNVNDCKIQIKANRYIVDIKLKVFSIEKATAVMNFFMEHTGYHYSSFYLRFNEGNMVRYRFASCKEDKEGFYCDVVIR